MNITETYFIELLRGFVTGSKEIKLNTTGVDEGELLALAKRHSVQGIVWHMANTLGHKFSDSTWAELSKAYDRTVMQMINRETAAISLCRKLSSEGIEHILFKGLTVSSCYPVSELRTFGDVDIIVHKEDEEPIREMLKNMGFSHSVADEGVVNAYKKGREHYEFHTALNVSLIKGQEFFDDIWGHTVAFGNDGSKMFEHEFHLCYLISHIEKHVYGGGAGIRMYLDIALYIKAHRDEIDFENVRRILRSCGLDKFLNTVLYLCDRWFSLNVPNWVEDLPEDLYRRVCDFTLSGGIFGELGHTSNISTALHARMSQGRKGARMRLLLSRVFPPKYELYRLYPKFEGKPLLIPIAWLRHIFSVISGKKLSRVKEIAELDTDSASTKQKFLESIGSGH